VSAPYQRRQLIKLAVIMCDDGNVNFLQNAPRTCDDYDRMFAFATFIITINAENN
jgi:hypothetical protein